MNVDYSSLNNYQYSNKSTLLKAIDVFSSPARGVLGGKTIDLFQDKQNAPKGTAAKVVTVFLSLVFFPVAIISTAALLAKLVYSSLNGEEKKVKAIVDGLKVINQRAEQLAKEGDVEKLVQELNQHPHLNRNLKVYAAIKASVAKKIQENVSWQVLAPHLKQLNVNDRMVFVADVIGKRFSKEAQEKAYQMNAMEIIDLVESVFGVDRDNQIECYKKIMSHALKVDGKEEYLLSLLKIDMIDELISKIARIENFAVLGELQQMQVKLNEQKLRLGQIPVENNTIHFANLMNQKEELQKNHKLAEAIREINRLKPKLERKFNDLMALCTSPDQWKAHRLAVLALITEVGRLGALVGLDPEYKVLILGIYKIIFDGLDGLWESNGVRTALNLLDTMLDQVQKQLEKIQQHFEDAKKHAQVVVEERDQAILQIALKLTYFQAHQQLSDIFVQKGGDHVAAWFDAQPQAV